MDFQTCLEKQNNLKTLFFACKTPDEKYAKIIELGRSLPEYPKEFKIDELLVKGCQSRLYLKSQLNAEGKMEFLVSSDALISAGLAALLLAIYQNEPPEALLKCPPTILTELEILNFLSPNRSNGLRSLFLRMQQDALKNLHLKN